MSFDELIEQADYLVVQGPLPKETHHLIGEEEPAKRLNWKPVNPLFTLPNAVITPHAAYYSQEAIAAVRDFAAHEVVRVLTGQQPISPVNAEELASARGQGHAGNS